MIPVLSLAAALMLYIDYRTSLHSITEMAKLLNQQDALVLVSNFRSNMSFWRNMEIGTIFGSLPVIALIGYDLYRSRHNMVTDQ